MELRSVDDLNNDCPVYGGPVVTLPPDLSVGSYFFASTLPRAWHMFDWIKSDLWPVATGKGVRIAILDTGYTKHPMGPEPVAARSFIARESWADGNGHGTHCAGTALGRRDEFGNGLGIAPDAELIVGKVLSNGGSGGSDGIAAGIRWAADQGAHVISMSLGGGGSYGPTNESIDYAWSKGCMVHASAGNSGYSGSGNTIGWPAKYSNCLCNGAYREDGQIANFSSGGRELDWATPGQNIVSFAHTGSGFRTMSGTSMSCPGGSGFLACLTELRLRQGLPAFTSAQQVRDYFTQSLIDAGAPGWDARFGLGKPDGSFLMKAILQQLTGAGT
jgi:subtilisin family serine protease